MTNTDVLLSKLLNKVEENCGLEKGTLAQMAVNHLVEKELLEEVGD